MSKLGKLQYSTSSPRSIILVANHNCIVRPFSEDTTYLVGGHKRRCSTWPASFLPADQCTQSEKCYIGYWERKDIRYGTWAMGTAIMTKWAVSYFFSNRVLMYHSGEASKSITIACVVLGAAGTFLVNTPSEVISQSLALYLEPWILL